MLPSLFACGYLLWYLRDLPIFGSSNKPIKEIGYIFKGSSSVKCFCLPSEKRIFSKRNDFAVTGCRGLVFRKAQQQMLKWREKCHMYPFIWIECRKKIFAADKELPPSFLKLKKNQLLLKERIHSPRPQIHTLNSSPN